MNAPRLVVVGSSNTDMIIQLDHIPRPGETVLGGRFVTAAGGKGANQAVAAARAGGRVTFIARVGDDMFGQRAVAGFAQEGIDVTHVVRNAGSPSGVALIFVAADGTRRIPGTPVTAVDTTAAGDVFNGVLAVALGEGRTAAEAVRLANAAAAISVTRLGAQPSAPTRAEIERLLRFA
jgi:ribokinase